MTDLVCILFLTSALCGSTFLFIVVLKVNSLNFGEAWLLILREDSLFSSFWFSLDLLNEKDIDWGDTGDGLTVPKILFVLLSFVFLFFSLVKPNPVSFGFSFEVVVLNPLNGELVDFSSAFGRLNPLNGELVDFSSDFVRLNPLNGELVDFSSDFGRLNPLNGELVDFFSDFGRLNPLNGELVDFSSDFGRLNPLNGELVVFSSDFGRLNPLNGEFVDFSEFEIIAFFSFLSEPKLNPIEGLNVPPERPEPY